MLLALAAYATYFINATQFILKLRAARRDERMALSTALRFRGPRMNAHMRDVRVALSVPRKRSRPIRFAARAASARCSAG